MKHRQRRPFEALGQLAVDETQMALDDDGFDSAKCHHHQESKSGSFVRRKFVEPRLGSSLFSIKAAHWRDGIRGTELGARGKERTARQRRVIRVKGSASRGGESGVEHEHEQEDEDEDEGSERLQLRITQ